MYEVIVRDHFSAAHQLRNYGGMCENLHGHNWKIEVIVSALKFAKKTGAKILGIVSRDGGYTKKVADVCILVPVIRDEMITPLAEAFQAVIWHAMVNHPLLR